MDSSFLLPPSAFCVRGPFTRVLIPFMPLICVLCSAKGVGRARGEARWLTSSLRKHRDLAGHLPNSGQGEIPLFREEIVQMPLSLRGRLRAPLGYVLFYSAASLGIFLPDTAFL